MEATNLAAITGRVSPRTTHDQPSADRLMQLMTDHERPLSAYVSSLLRDSHAVRDCLQDTFLRAYLLLRNGRSVETVWLYRVAHNRAMDEYRPRRFISRERVTGPLSFGRQEERVELWEPFDGLSTLDREVLFLYCYAGFQTEEIAERLGVSDAAMRQRIYRARDQFRHLYQAEA